MLYSVIDIWNKRKFSMNYKKFSDSGVNHIMIASEKYWNQMTTNRVWQMRSRYYINNSSWRCLCLLSCTFRLWMNTSKQWNMPPSEYHIHCDFESMCVILCAAYGRWNLELNGVSHAPNEIIMQLTLDRFGLWIQSAFTAKTSTHSTFHGLYVFQ